MRRGITAAAVTIAAMLLVGACGHGGARPAPAAAPSPALDPSPPISAVTDDYFGNGGEYLGKVVTLTGEVTRVLTPTAFVLTGQEFDDDSLLVLTLTDASVRAGTRVTVTGEVDRFRFTAFDRDYRLPYGSDTAPSGGQEFLIARNIGAAASRNAADR